MNRGRSRIRDGRRGDDPGLCRCTLRCPCRCPCCNRCPCRPGRCPCARLRLCHLTRLLLRQPIPSRLHRPRQQLVPPRRIHHGAEKVLELLGLRVLGAPDGREQSSRAQSTTAPELLDEVLRSTESELLGDRQALVPVEVAQGAPGERRQLQLLELRRGAANLVQQEDQLLVVRRALLSAVSVISRSSHHRPPFDHGMPSGRAPRPARRPSPRRPPPAAPKYPAENPSG